MSQRKKIFIARTNEFEVYESIKRAFACLSIPLTFSKAVIKLNLCSLKMRETGATSDPIIVEQLVKFLNEHNISVKLVESDSSSKNADMAFTYLGFKDLEKKYDVKCINLSKDKILVKKIDGYYLKSVKIPETLETAEFFITHPKMKTHSGMKVCFTGALKNQFGCLIDRNKTVYHRAIHEVIADVNRIFVSDLTIMDGIIAMTGYGPTDGVPQRLNLLLASEDPVAIDALGARFFGFDPKKIKYLKLASNSGLGNMTYSVIGDKIEDVHLNMHMNKLITSSFDLLSSIGISESA